MWLETDGQGGEQDELPGTAGRGEAECRACDQHSDDASA